MSTASLFGDWFLFVANIYSHYLKLGPYDREQLASPPLYPTSVFIIIGVTATYSVCHNEIIGHEASPES